VQWVNFVFVVIYENILDMGMGMSSMMVRYS